MRVAVAQIDDPKLAEPAEPRRLHRAPRGGAIPGYMFDSLDEALPFAETDWPLANAELLAAALAYESRTYLLVSNRVGSGRPSSAVAARSSTPPERVWQRRMR